MFETLTNLEMKIADLKGLKSGRLRLGVVTTAKYLAPEILGEFSRLYPGIDLALKVTNREHIIDRMHANVDDLYIMGHASNEELEIESYPFAPNPLVFIAPRDHPLVGKKKIPLSEIAKEPFIIREPGSGIRDSTVKTFSKYNVQPRVRMELGSNEAIKHAVVGGLGLAVLSLHTLSLESVDGPVAILDVQGFPIMRHWYLVHPRGKELSLVAKTFLEFAVQNEPRNYDRMEVLWPGLKPLLKKAKNDKPGKKKAAKKKR